MLLPVVQLGERLIDLNSLPRWGLKSAARENAKQDDLGVRLARRI